MSGTIPPLPNSPSWCGALLKHRENFTFTFYRRSLLIETFPMRYPVKLRVLKAKGVQVIQSVKQKVKN
jgi:hypothetical protein